MPTKDTATTNLTRHEEDLSPLIASETKTSSGSLV